MKHRPPTRGPRGPHARVLPFLMLPAILPVASLAYGEEETGGSGVSEVSSAPESSAPEPPPAVAPLEPESKLNEEWWRERLEVTNCRANAPEARVLLHGDSIVHLWEDGGKAIWARELAPLGAVNQGFNGDRMQHQLWRLRHAGLERSGARVVVLLIGTNNLGFDPLDRLEATVEAMLGEIRERLPRARVLLLGLLPRGAADDPHRDRIRSLNEAFSRMAGPGIRFLDFGDRLLEPDGSISRDVMYDGLHPTEEGYRRWAEAMMPVLREMLAEAGSGD